MNAKPQPPPTETKKRATPKPSPETEALRAIRDLRKLKERADHAFATYRLVRDECIKQSVNIHAGLSTEAAAIVKAFEKPEEPETVDALGKNGAGQ